MFREKYNAITKTQDGWVDQVLLTKKFVMPSGLIFYYPGIKLTSTGYIEGNTNVRNYPIQNLATAEIIPIAATYVWHGMKAAGMRSLIVNTVHDSIITDEDTAETEQIDIITREAFSEKTVQYLKTVHGMEFSIPLETETEINQNWSYTPEEKHVNS